MNHQITLEEIGLIPKQEKVSEQGGPLRKVYAFPCGGCICNHCANSVECCDHCMEETDFACFSCDECRRYDEKGILDNWRENCGQYKITNSHAKRTRKKLKVVKMESEG